MLKSIELLKWRNVLNLPLKMPKKTFVSPGNRKLRSRPSCHSGHSSSQSLAQFALLEFTNITGHQQVVFQDLFASAV